MPSSYAVSDLIECVFGEKMLLERGIACYPGSLSLSVCPLPALLLVGPGPSCHHPSIFGIVRGQRPSTPQGTGEPVFSVASAEERKKPVLE